MQPTSVSFGTILLIAIASVLGVTGDVLTGEVLGALDWVSSDPTKATVVFGNQGQVFLVPTAANNSGATVTLSVKGDANPTTPAGFNGSIVVTWQADEATSVVLSATPVAQADFLAATTPVGVNATSAA